MPGKVNRLSDLALLNDKDLILLLSDLYIETAKKLTVIEKKKPSGELFNSVLLHYIYNKYLLNQSYTKKEYEQFFKKLEQACNWASDQSTDQQGDPNIGLYEAHYATAVMTCFSKIKHLLKFKELKDDVTLNFSENYFYVKENNENGKIDKIFLFIDNVDTHEITQNDLITLNTILNLEKISKKNDQADIDLIAENYKNGLKTIKRCFQSKNQEHIDILVKAFQSQNQEHIDILVKAFQSQNQEHINILVKAFQSQNQEHIDILVKAFQSQNQEYIDSVIDAFSLRNTISEAIDFYSKLPVLDQRDLPPGPGLRMQPTAVVATLQKEKNQLNQQLAEATPSNYDALSINTLKIANTCKETIEKNIPEKIQLREQSHQNNSQEQPSTLTRLLEKLSSLIGRLRGKTPAPAQANPPDIQTTRTKQLENLSLFSKPKVLNEAPENDQVPGSPLQPKS